ncbi:TPA: hypothetical protein DEG21_03840 [Patescibacteria group bacterium]|nr:hypothetical protein [Candidatus Gracilibacteria bacterium]HBY74982.1 hypothetical protein [Candidatus Gracilibacteria bacterium]
MKLVSSINILTIQVFLSKTYNPNHHLSTSSLVITVGFQLRRLSIITELIFIKALSVVSNSFPHLLYL